MKQMALNWGNRPRDATHCEVLSFMLMIKFIIMHLLQYNLRRKRLPGGETQRHRRIQHRNVLQTTTTTTNRQRRSQSPIVQLIEVFWLLPPDPPPKLLQQQNCHLHAERINQTLLKYSKCIQRFFGLGRGAVKSKPSHSAAS